MNFTTKPSYYQVGGSLTNNDPNYVKRHADDDFYNGLKAGELCYVLNSRQMGKSSLQVRTIQRLRNDGIACAAIDISEIGNRGVTPEQWYAGLLRILENNFNLSDVVNVRTWWRDRNFLAPVQRLSEFIETVLLANIASNIVIFIDEIDSILALDFCADDFLALIRSCYNKRANNSEFDRLTWALLGVASPTDLCQDKNASNNTPFNIGKAIELTGFDERESQPLAAGLADITDSYQEVLREVLSWTGGQPFLTQKLCKLLLENSHLIRDLPPPAPPYQGGEKEEVKNFTQTEKEEVKNFTQTEKEEVKNFTQTEKEEVKNFTQTEKEEVKNFTQTEKEEVKNFTQTEKEQLKNLPQTEKEQLKNFTHGQKQQLNNPKDWVEKVVRLKIVDNWEFQDVPEHLSTIRDRLFKENQRIVRRLGLYQQILQQVEVIPDGSAEQMELRLTGLIVKSGNKLTLANPIYEAIFNATIIQNKLDQLAPYSSAIKAWFNSKCQDNSQLLQGKYLQSALIWAAEKSLRNEDFQFLTASQKLMLTDQNQLLEATKLEIKEAVNDAQKAQLETEAAKQKAKQWIGLGSAVLAVSLAGAIGFSTLAYQRFKLAQASIEIEQTGSDALLLAVSQKTENSQALSEALLRAIASGKALKNLVKNQPHLELYPATRPLLALQVILDKVSNEKQQIQQSTLPLRKMNWKAHKGAITSVAFSPDSQIIATAGVDDSVRIWSLSGQKVSEWKAFQKSINMLSFSPDGKTLATAGKDSKVKLWDLSGKKIYEFQAMSGSVTSISFSPDSKFLAAAGIESNAALWQISPIPKTRLMPIFLPGHNGLVRSVNFSQTGDFLTTLDGKSTVRIWNSSGKLIKKLPVEAIGISFSLNQQQQRFATVTLNGKIGLWNLSKQELVNEFQTLHLDAKSISFSPDGERLATVGIDKTVRLWNLAGRQVAQFEFAENVVSVSWSRDGKQIAVAGSNGTVWLREVESLEELLKESCKFFTNQPEYLTRVSSLCQ